MSTYRDRDREKASVREVQGRGGGGGKRGREERGRWWLGKVKHVECWRLSMNESSTVNSPTHCGIYIHPTPHYQYGTEITHIRLSDMMRWQETGVQIRSR